MKRSSPRVVWEDMFPPSDDSLVAAPKTRGYRITTVDDYYNLERLVLDCMLKPVWVRQTFPSTSEPASRYLMRLVDELLTDPNIAEPTDG